MESDAWPMRPERILADLRAALPRDCDHLHRRGLEQERRRPAVSDLHAGQRLHARRLRDDGLRRPGGAGCEGRLARRVVVALVGDGGFGQNPAMLATAFEEDIAVVWVIMNNRAFGTIAGLEKAHFGTTFGTVFEKNGKS